MKERGQLTVLNNNEIWKPVGEFIGRYEISNLGRVRSLEDNHGKPIKRIKKQSLTQTGYYEVQLSIKDENHHRKVHRLLALAFIPNPDCKPHINHIDGNKLNNSLDNLEWCTQQENIQHAYDTGLNPTNAESLKGNKWGITSKYHNVSWDKTRGKWKASLKEKQRMIFQKRFDSEEDAALYVNKMLDSLGDTKRPRNVII